MEATYTYTGGRNDTQGSAMARANNIDFEFTAQNYALNKDPEYYIYLYNLSETNMGDGNSFYVSRPPLIKSFKIVMKPKGTPYILATRFPQPIPVPKGNVDTNEIDVVQQDARRFVMDIINPDNLTVDQDAFIDPGKVTGIGNDLGKKGVFWSFNGPGATMDGERTYIIVDRKRITVFEAPTEAEVKNASDKMAKNYKKQIQEADAFYVSNPADFGKFVTPEHHAALDFYGEERPWHSAKAQASECPICGARMRAGAAFHKTEDGTLCVNDWDRAIKSGAKTRAQAYEATEDEKYAPKTAVRQERPSEEV